MKGTANRGGLTPIVQTERGAFHLAIARRRSRLPTAARVLWPRHRRRKSGQHATEFGRQRLRVGLVLNCHLAPIASAICLWR